MSVTKLQVSCLEKKISKLTATTGVKLDDELHNDMKEMIAEATNEIHRSYQSNTFQRLF